MNAILEFLQQRRSFTRLSSPAPNADELEQMFQAACRVPDHARLKPWRFMVIEGQGLHALGQLFAKAMAEQDSELSADKLEDIARRPFRAPMIIVVVAVTQAFPKVPVSEQLLSAGCAAHNIMLAANTFGYGGIWRTGPMAENPIVRKGLNLADNEHLVGFLYIGSTEEQKNPQAPIDTQAFVEHWQGN